MSTRDISSCKENVKERRWDVNFEYTCISSNSASNLVVNKGFRQIVTMNLNIDLISKLKIQAILYSLFYILSFYSQNQNILFKMFIFLSTNILYFFKYNQNISTIYAFSMYHVSVTIC